MDEPLSAEVLHALAHPFRLAALVAVEGRDQAPDELASVLGVREPEMMEHLNVLDAAGLVDIDSYSGLVRARSAGWSTVAERLARLQEGSGGG